VRGKFLFALRLGKSTLIEKLNTQEIDALVHVLDHDTTIQQNYGALLITGNVKV